MSFFETDFNKVGVSMLDKSVPADALEYLLKRGHTRAAIKAANYRFLSDEGQIARLFPASLRGEHSRNTCTLDPDDKACWWPLWAIVLPFDAEYGIARIEYHVAEIGKTDGPAKFLSPSGEQMLYIPPTVTRKQLLDGKAPLYLIESPFKSVVAASRGLACVGVNGCFGAFEKDTACGKLRADLREYLKPGREVCLLTDVDARSNLNVRKSLVAFMDIAATDCAPVYVELPDLGDSKTGIDDYFAAGHTLKDFDKLPRHARDSAMLNELRAAFYDLTEIGLAQRFVAQHGRDIRHDPKAKEWYSWTPSGYVAGDLEPRRCMKRTVDALKLESDAEKGEEAAKARKRFAIVASRDSTRLAALRTAAIDPAIEIDAAQFDADPNLFGVKNGVLDLRVGKLLAPSRDLMVTKSAACAFDPKATAPTFAKFIDSAANGDKDLRRHVQEVFGAALLGRAIRTQLHIIYGPTATGKSVIIEIALALLGDYGMPSKSDLLLRQRGANDPERPSPYLKTLRGRRLVVCSELNEGTAFDDALIKDLTGGDTIATRGLHEAPITFKNTAVIWVRANHLPIIGADAAMRERVIVTPLEHVIDAAERDKDLAARIIANELPGVLNWALVGMRRYIARGLEFELPAAAVKATAKMQRESDVVGMWLNECVKVDLAKADTWRDESNEIVRSYRDWCASNGHIAKSSKSLYQSLRSRFGLDDAWPLASSGKYYATGFRLVRHPVMQDIVDSHAADIAAKAEINEHLAKQLADANRELATLKDAQTSSAASAASAPFRAPVIPIKRALET